MQWNHIGGVWVRGNDLGAGHLLSLEDCMSLCLSHVDCRSIDYFRPRTNVSCYLNNITRLEAASDWMSSTSYDYYDFFKSIDGESQYVPWSVQCLVGSWYPFTHMLYGCFTNFSAIALKLQCQKSKPLAPGKFEWNFWHVIFKPILVINGLVTLVKLPYNNCHPTLVMIVSMG